MRIIAQCLKCNRQFDATGYASGAIFRCYCGAGVKVPNRSADPHSDVVSCASCGSPRQRKSDHCQYCQADFTLFEQDRHTVCPACMTRISDKARFCHCCGVKIEPERYAGDKTELRCPGCKNPQSLYSRVLTKTGVGFLECQCCAGMWISQKVFEQLQKHADSVSIERTSNLQDNASTSDAASFSYRKCPECGKLMNRKNFARTSGIILDVCGEHGFWFDNDELSAVVTWIKANGVEAINRSEAKIDEIIARHEDSMRKLSRFPDAISETKTRKVGDDVDLDVVLEVVFTFFD